MPRFGLLSLTLAALTSNAVAQDRVPSFVDMRLSVEGASLRYDRSDNGGSAVEQAYDLGTRVGVSWIGSLGIDAWGGVVWGLGGSWGYNTDEFGADDAVLQTATLDLYLGYAYAFSESLQIEFIPTITVGRAWLDIDRDVSYSEAETYWEYGFRGNLVWTFGNGFQIGGTGSLLRSKSGEFRSPVVIAPGPPIDIDDRAHEFEAIRLTAGLFIGVRL